MYIIKPIWNAVLSSLIAKAGTTILNGKSSLVMFVTSIDEFFTNNSKSASLVCLSKNSVIGFLTNVGSASSLTLIGYLYDFTQSYQIVFIIALCFHLINLILLVVICLRYNGVGDK